VLTMLARLVAVLFVASAAIAAPFADVQSRAAAVNYPLHTSDRWILDANNQRVKLRCANWASCLPWSEGRRKTNDLRCL
jgi:hypothetical protein